MRIFTSFQVGVGQNIHHLSGESRSVYSLPFRWESVSIFTTFQMGVGQNIHHLSGESRSEYSQPFHMLSWRMGAATFSFSVLNEFCVNVLSSFTPRARPFPRYIAHETGRFVLLFFKAVLYSVLRARREACLKLLHPHPPPPPPNPPQNAPPIHPSPPSLPPPPPSGKLDPKKESGDTDKMQPCKVVAGDITLSRQVECTWSFLLCRVRNTCTPV